MLKWWLLFLFDLAAVVCAVKSGFLTFNTSGAGGTPAAVGSGSATEAAGWMTVACIAAFGAFLAAIIPATVL